jgi:hypothetical protein
MVGEMTWSSSASPARVIKSSTQLSKEDWRDKMEFFCVTYKTNPVLHSGEQGWLEGCHGVLLLHEQE